VSQYKTYGKVQIEGTQDYVAGVTGCLDVIDSIPDGRKLLQQICAKAHTVTMQDTTSGNACAAGAGLFVAAGASPQNVMAHAVSQTGLAMNLLQDLMAGNTTVNELPSGWAYELPRLLRPYLTPGRGAASKVSFNHSKTFSCEHDPAMHQRPPAVGLAHELIHALHNSSGINMALAKKNNENIEELITTGMPPYNFEELSDNKMRTQWPSHLHLRQDY